MAQGIQERVGGEMTGDFTGGGASHAIADDEGGLLGQCGARVLVGVANTSAMGEHGVGEWRSVRGGGGCILRLDQLQSRSIGHFGTGDTLISGSLKQYSLQEWRPMVFCFGNRGDGSQGSLESLMETMD